MGLTEAQFTNAEAISSSLRCPICHEVFDDPVFCSGRPCQCTFCRACLERALERAPICPMDRNPMKVTDVTTHRFVKGLIDELQVRCSHAEEGCYWTGRLDARPGHEERCVARRAQSLEAEVALKTAKIAELQTVIDGVQRLILGHGKEHKALPGANGQAESEMPMEEQLCGELAYASCLAPSRLPPPPRLAGQTLASHPYFSRQEERFPLVFVGDVPAAISQDPRGDSQARGDGLPADPLSSRSGLPIQPVDWSQVQVETGAAEGRVLGERLLGGGTGSGIALVSVNVAAGSGTATGGAGLEAASAAPADEAPAVELARAAGAFSPARLPPPPMPLMPPAQLSQDHPWSSFFAGDMPAPVMSEAHMRQTSATLPNDAVAQPLPPAIQMPGAAMEARTVRIERNRVSQEGQLEDEAEEEPELEEPREAASESSNALVQVEEEPQLAPHAETTFQDYSMDRGPSPSPVSPHFGEGGEPETEEHPPEEAV